MNKIHHSFKHGKNFKIGEFCVIEEDVVVGDNVELQNYVLLKKGTRIGNDCYIDSYVRSSGDNEIGNGVTVRFGATIARKVRVGEKAFISPNVMTIYSQPDGKTSTETIIGHGAFIGTAAVIGPDVWIMPNTVVGAMSYVNKSTEACFNGESYLYIGIPAKKIGRL